MKFSHFSFAGHGVRSEKCFTAEQQARSNAADTSLCKFWLRPQRIELVATGATRKKCVQSLKSPIPLYNRLALTLHSQSSVTQLLTVHAGDVRRSGEFRWPRIHRRHRVTRLNKRHSGKIVISFANFLFRYISFNVKSENLVVHIANTI